LVVVARNPLEDIRNLRTIVLTVKRGREYRRTDYRLIAAEEMKDD
jgi:imidazolonepropionase-like amidohydrolase